MRDKECASGHTRRKTKREAVRRILGPVRDWVKLYTWHRYLYRPVMRILHHYNLHYMPPSIPPIDPGRGINPFYQEQHHWCHWCGLRGTSRIPATDRLYCTSSPRREDLIL